MRVISWNMKGSRANRPVWEELNRLEPDIALLQEVGKFPDWMKSTEYEWVARNAIRANGKSQHFSTGIVVKGKILEEVTLRAKLDWANPILEFFSGNIVSCKAKLAESGKTINLVSVYSPAWSIESTVIGHHLDGVDLSKFKLNGNPWLWVTEILWLALQGIKLDGNDIWIVGGDFNSSPRFDQRQPNGSLFPPMMRGTMHFLQRMKALGLGECLFEYNGKYIPTFKNARSKRIEDQLDHLFIQTQYLKALTNCGVGRPEILTDNLSDHLPIIADFNDWNLIYK